MSTTRFRLVSNYLFDVISIKCVNRVHDMAREKHRINICIEKPVWKIGKQLAKKAKRSLSNELETLIVEEAVRRGLKGAQ